MPIYNIYVGYEDGQRIETIKFDNMDAALLEASSIACDEFIDLAERKGYLVLEDFEEEYNVSEHGDKAVDEFVKYQMQYVNLYVEEVI